MERGGISDAGMKRIASKTAQEGFDLDNWVDDMYEEVVSRVSVEVPDELQEEAYNSLAYMLRIEE